MDAIVKMLEKHQPFFEKISRNIYLQGHQGRIRGCMPIVLSSIFSADRHPSRRSWNHVAPAAHRLVQQAVQLHHGRHGHHGCRHHCQELHGIHEPSARRQGAQRRSPPWLPPSAACCCSQSRSSPPSSTAPNFRSSIAPAWARAACFSAYIAAFITVWVYKFCVSRDLTIKLPKEVPGAIAQNFRDIIPFGGAVIICGIIDVVVRNLMGVPVLRSCLSNCSPRSSPLQKPIRPYPYPGSHRVLLVHRRPRSFDRQPGIDPIRLANQAENLQVLLAGGHPPIPLTFNMSLVGEFGGTGATFIVPLLLILFMKKRLKAVGKASIVPIGLRCQRTAALWRADDP